MASRGHVSGGAAICWRAGQRSLPPPLQPTALSCLRQGVPPHRLLWPQPGAGSAGRSSRSVKAHCVLSHTWPFLTEEPVESHWPHFWPDTHGCLLYPTHHVTPRDWFQLGRDRPLQDPSRAQGRGHTPSSQAPCLSGPRFFWSVCGLSPGP